MKNKILKAQMRGQFMDMQKTRGGIPDRLAFCGLRRCDLDRIDVPYVIGRIGWFSCSHPTPKDRIFIHCTDRKKVNAYGNCLWALSWKYEHLSDYDKNHIIRTIAKYRFTFPRSLNQKIKSLLK